LIHNPQDRDDSDNFESGKHKFLLHNLRAVERGTLLDGYGLPKKALLLAALINSLKM
jgi:hypothetical protein